MGMFAAQLYWGLVLLTDGKQKLFVPFVQCTLNTNYRDFINTEFKKNNFHSFLNNKAFFYRFNLICFFKFTMCVIANFMVFKHKLNFTSGSHLLSL